MKKQISLSVGGYITKEKEKIIIEMFNSLGNLVRASKKDGMRIESISVISKDVVDYEEG